MKDIRKHKELARIQRSKFSSFSIALVGYTNSGKSTLFNAITQGHAMSKDQLFSTLDPTVRKISLPGKHRAIISDTVGFLNELPHHLVESFKTTLEETVNADILLHVIDITSECLEGRRIAVLNVLEELGMKDKTNIVVLNKIDKVNNKNEIERIKRDFHNAFSISALKGEGIDELKDEIIRFMQKDHERIEVVLPHRHYSLAKTIRENGTVEREEYREKGLFISAYLPKSIKHKIFKRLKEKK